MVGRDVTAVEALPRGGDAGRAMAARRRVGLDEPPKRPAEGGLHEQLADLRHAAARIEHRGAARRIDVELATRLRDGEQAVHVLVHRKAVLGVLHGRRQHLADRLRAARLEQREVGVDGARHRERQVSVGSRTGRDAIEPAPAEEGRRGQRGRGALPAQRERLSRPRVVNERHALAAERVRRRRLDHGRGEAGGRRRRRTRCRPRGACACRPSTPADARSRRRPGCPTPRAAWSSSPRRDAPARESVRSVGSSPHLHDISGDSTAGARRQPLCRHAPPTGHAAQAGR